VLAGVAGVGLIAAMIMLASKGRRGGDDSDEEEDEEEYGAPAAGAGLPLVLPAAAAGCR
jgi:hypothetical protein